MRSSLVLGPPLSPCSTSYGPKVSALESSISQPRLVRPLSSSHACPLNRCWGVSSSGTRHSPGALARAAASDSVPLPPRPNPSPTPLAHLRSWLGAIPRVGVLERYVVTQLLVPFSLSLVSITLLALCIATAHELTIIGLCPWPTLWKALCAGTLWAYRLPFYAGLALPMAALISSLLTVGELGANRETLALQASGVGPLRVAVVLGGAFLVLALAHLALAEAVTPHANRQAAALMRLVRSPRMRTRASIPNTPALLQRLKEGLPEGPTVRQAVIVPEFRDDCLHRLFYAHRCDQGVMLHPTLVQMDQENSGETPLHQGSFLSPRRKLPPSYTQQSPTTPASRRYWAQSASRGLGEQGRCSIPSLLVTAEEASWNGKRKLWEFASGTRYVVGTLPTQSAFSVEQTQVIPTDEFLRATGGVTSTEDAPTGIETIVAGPNESSSGRKIPVAADKQEDSSMSPPSEVSVTSADGSETELIPMTSPALEVLAQEQEQGLVQEQVETPRTPMTPMTPSVATNRALPSLQFWSSFEFLRVQGLGRMPLELADLGFGRSLDDMSAREMLRMGSFLRSCRNHKEALNVQVKMHQKLALPFASPVFAAVGAVAGFRIPRQQSQMGFGVALALIFLYYTSTVLGVLFAQVLPPILAAWLPNMMGVLVCLVLLDSSNRLQKLLSRTSGAGDDGG